MRCALLAARRPAVTVEPDAIYVRDGGVWSSAGVTTAIDLALALVVYLRRPGGQSQYSALLATQAEHDDGRFDELGRWVGENLVADLRIERSAERVGMSPRNFAHRYVEKRKRTPARAVEAIRVEAARRVLEEGGDRVDAVARRCGFGNEERMRRAFARHLGIPPRAYRERFAAA